MKKIVSILMIAMMVLSVFTIFASAADEPTLTVETVKAEPGETVEVNVFIENNPGIYCYALAFEYDTTRLNLVDKAANTTDWGGSQTVGTKLVWDSSTGDIAFNGLMLTLTFEVLADAADGTAEVTVVYEEGDLCNYDEEDILPVVVPGGVVIGGDQGGATPSVPELVWPEGECAVGVQSVAAQAGDTVEVQVLINNNPGIYCYALAFEYDTTRLNLVDKAANTTDWGGSQTVGTKLVWDSSTGDIDFNGLMLTLTFEVLADAADGNAEVTVVYEEGDLCNYDEEDILPVIVPGYVVIGNAGGDAPAGPVIPELVWPEGECAVGVQSVAGNAGETVEVQVLINNNPGIYCYTVGFEYDTTRLSLVNKAANTTDWGGSQTVGTKLVWDSSAGDINFNGLMLTLTFEVLADAADGNALVTITYDEGDLCNYDEEDVLPVIIPGYVVIGNGEGGEVACQHTKTTTTTVDATCTTAGSVTVTCDDCGETISTEEIDALGHTAGAAVKENEKAPTCDVVGSYESVVYCSVCKAELSRDFKTVAALGHTAGQTVVENAVAADCVNDGKYDNVVYCTVCGAEMSRETVTVDALGHSYDEDVTAPTCTADGYTTYTCSVCGDSYVGNTVAALGHTAGKTVVENSVAADCVNDGKYDNVVYCTVCGAEMSRETVTVDALGHTAGETVVENKVDPDCVNDGKYDNVVYCTVCGTEMSRETITVDALGHTAADAVVENASEGTCTAGGTYDLVVYCSVCKAELSRETVEVDAQGHTFVETVTTVVAATCGTDGYNLKTVACSVCGDVASSVKVYVPATGVHTPGAEATCTTAQTCTDCGKVLVAAKGHTAAEAVKEDVVEATCTSSGSYKNAVYCADCGELMYRQLVYVAPVAHTPSADATCTDDQICTVCEKVLVAAKGHTAAEVVEEDVVEATCGKSGSYKKAVYCADCGELLYRQLVYVAPTGVHTPGAEATCTTPQTCTDCGKVLVAAKGHTHGEAQYTTIVEATETTSGSMYKTVYCTECGDRIYRQLVYVAPLGRKED